MTEPRALTTDINMAVPPMTARFLPVSTDDRGRITYREWSPLYGAFLSFFGLVITSAPCVVVTMSPAKTSTARIGDWLVIALFLASGLCILFIGIHLAFRRRWLVIDPTARTAQFRTTGLRHTQSPEFPVTELELTIRPLCFGSGRPDCERRFPTALIAQRDRDLLVLARSDHTARVEAVAASLSAAIGIPVRHESTPLRSAC